MRLRSGLIALVVATAIPLVAFGAAVAALLVGLAQDNFAQAARDRARAVMSAVDAQLKGYVTTLQALASLRSIAADDLAAFHSDAVAALRTQADWENLVLDAPDGRQLVNASVPFGQPLPSRVDRESTRAVVASARPVVVGLRPRPLTDALAIPIRVPVVRDGHVVYVVTAVVRPESFERLLVEQALPADWVCGLVDADGKFVARLPKRPVGSAASSAFLNAIAGARQGWYRGLTAEGLDSYTAFDTSDLAHWSIGIAIPSQVVLAGAKRATWLMGGAAACCAFLAIVAALWLGRLIAAPISTLAARVARGSVGNEAAVDSEITEIAELVVALEKAAAVEVERRNLVERERRALEQADRTKDEFLAMLSHELRNPLAAIATSSHVLKLAAPAGPAALSARGVIERQTAHMTRLVEDLLDVSRITVGKATLVLEPLDLAELVTRLVDLWRDSDRLARYSIRLDAPRPVWVRGDRARLEQVVANLLDNAVKFSPGGGAIGVDVFEQAGDATIAVGDHGNGIPADQLDHVFELFVQAPQDLSRPLGGLGVGLAVVKRLVELHGGTVAAASGGAGAGARFTVCLPTIPVPVTDDRCAATERSPASCRDILLVEDNDDARTTTVLLLALLGHQVTEASTGAEGIRLAAERRPECVLIDIGLPDRSGYEVARTIRAGGSRATMIALTGYGQPQDRTRAIDAGFDHHLTKPLSPELLESLLAGKPPAAG